MKFKEFIKKMLKHKKLVLGIILLVIVSLLVIRIINNKNKVDVDHLLSELKKSSELTSAKLEMTGIYHYKDKGVPIINKSNFIMVYTATVRAGINIDDVRILQNGIKKITVYIPKSEIIGVEVDTNNIKYYDEHFALFNFNPKEDSNKAITEAKKDAEAKAIETGILELSDNQASTLIVGILSPIIPKNCKIDVKINE